METVIPRSRVHPRPFYIRLSFFSYPLHHVQPPLYPSGPVSCSAHWHGSPPSQRPTSHHCKLRDPVHRALNRPQPWPDGRARGDLHQRRIKQLQLVLQLPGRRRSNLSARCSVSRRFIHRGLQKRRSSRQQCDDFDYGRGQRWRCVESLHFCRPGGWLTSGCNRLVPGSLRRGTRFLGCINSRRGKNKRRRTPHGWIPRCNICSGGTLVRELVISISRLGRGSCIYFDIGGISMPLPVRCRHGLDIAGHPYKIHREL
ncbi:hypothetical protein C8R44DRAFT_144978 [Mycena epipterygia]|nr:hypothetical protein C8R44DRAFT_144978 [Mycena epipterygia]